MPRFPFYLLSGRVPGNLIVERSSQDRIEVFYVPPKEGREGSTDLRVRLLLFDLTAAHLTIFPISTRDDESFLQAKYEQVQRITIADHDYIGSDLREVPISTEITL